MNLIHELVEILLDINIIEKITGMKYTDVVYTRLTANLWGYDKAVVREFDKDGNELEMVNKGIHIVNDRPYILTKAVETIEYRTRTLNINGTTIVTLSSSPIAAFIGILEKLEAHTLGNRGQVNMFFHEIQRVVSSVNRTNVAVPKALTHLFGGNWEYRHCESVKGLTSSITQRWNEYNTLSFRTTADIVLVTDCEFLLELVPTFMEES